MITLKKIKLLLFGLLLTILSGCGEYIPDTVVYTEVPTTYVVYDYPKYYSVYQPKYYYRYYNVRTHRNDRIYLRRHDPRTEPKDNRNNRPSKPRRR